MLHSRELWSTGWELLLKEPGLPLSPVARITHCLSLPQNFQVSVSGLEVDHFIHFLHFPLFLFGYGKQQSWEWLSLLFWERNGPVSVDFVRGAISYQDSICQEAVSRLKFLKFYLGNVSLWDQAQVTVVEELEGYETRRGEKRREERRKKTKNSNF